MVLKKKFLFFVFIILISFLFLLFLFLRSDFLEKTISFSYNIHHSFSFSKINPPPSRIFGKSVLKEPYKTKAVYLTAYKASSDKKLKKIINLIKRTELNAVVVDIKDYSGKVFYSVHDSKLKDLATEYPILNLAEIVSKFHKEKIYTIARIVVFQDPQLANKKRDWAILDKSGNLWKDRKGLAWMDPASKKVWDYNIDLAYDVSRFGFDEINFDYLRFPSESNLDNAVFPVWDKKTSKREVIKNFVEYLKKRLRKEDFWLSADIFGMTLEAKDDMGIGQILEDFILNFDIISPMIYPSHYSVGYNGFKNPALHPYEVIFNSLTKGKERILNNSKIPIEIKNNLSKKIRPWLQFFNLGANYTSEMIKKEKQAVYNAGFSGWFMWDPKNNYYENAFEK